MERTTTKRDQLVAARALAHQARAHADALIVALDEPKRHDPIILAAQHTAEAAQTSMRIYADWLNDRP